MLIVVMKRSIISMHTVLEGDSIHQLTHRGALDQTHLLELTQIVLQGSTLPFSTQAILIDHRVQGNIQRIPL